MVCPTGGCKHLDFPDSFNSSLFDVYEGVYDAFNITQVNMDIIACNMRVLPGLLNGTDEDIQLLLPDQLAELTRIAIESRESADATCEAFDSVKGKLAELILGSQVTKKEVQMEQKTKAVKVRQLSEFDASKATLDEVLK